MSKVKKIEIPHYELLYMVSNKYAEDEIKPILEKVEKIIKNRGGEITVVEEWGKKRLAYPMKQFSYAYYILVEFDSDGENIAAINRDLRIMNEVLRHQIVVKIVKTAKEIAKEKEISKKIASKNKEREKIEVEAVKEKKKEKVDMEELDEKLDKILETDDLL